MLNDTNTPFRTLRSIARDEELSVGTVVEIVHLIWGPRECEILEFTADGNYARAKNLRTGEQFFTRLDRDLARKVEN